jgi:hypothetical protein
MPLGNHCFDKARLTKGRTKLWQKFGEVKVRESLNIITNKINP